MAASSSAAGARRRQPPGNRPPGGRGGWRARVLDPFRSRLRNKLLLFMLLLSILPITAVTAMAIARSSHAMEREMIQFNGSQLSTVSEYMSEKLSQLDELLNAIIIDDKISDRMGKLDNDDITQFYRANDYINNKLSSIYYANQSVLNRVMLDVDNIGKTYVVSGYEESIKNASPLASVRWMSFDLEHSKLNYANDTVKKSFMLMRPINRFEDRKPLGAAALDVKWSLMDRMLSALRKDEGARVYLVDADGNILYSPQAEAPASESEGLLRSLKPQPGSLASFEKIGDTYLFRSEVPYTFFSVVKLVPGDLISRSSEDIIRSSFWIGAGVVCVCIALSVLLAYMMTKPITNLVRYMRKLDWIKTDFVASRNRQDEIGLLENSFELMVNNIKGLIQFEYEATIAKRTAEVKALQAQINPHFLHNTLQLISGMALEKNVPEIHKIVKAIGGMFRYSIRSLPDAATLREDWQHMRNYLYIQEMRFPNKVKVDERLPEAFETLPIPLLTLQPIVENAFEHGFRRKLDDWHIAIGAELRGDVAVIRIADNGEGIEPQRLAELRRALDANGALYRESESLGLRNVDARIKLRFGAAYGLRIDSLEGAGTAIEIHLPAGPELTGEREGEGG
ncbi:sensor histidine kinase [Cohnella sp. GCM10012308]|uniref:sensor histidine kinase n=1 Tax=Cohnella sp. GCM10012308 TaxID=3317329 RepID=UPI0036170A77